MRTSTPLITATGGASITVTGARPGRTVEVQGYTQNHYGTATWGNDPTPVDRAGTADANGAVTFSDFRLSSNSRFRAREIGCSFSPSGPSVTVSVKTLLTLEARRESTRRYTLSGRSLPARAGGLVVSLYRVNGTSEVLLAQARADAASGQYSVAVRFSSGGRVDLVTKTGQDAQNAPGRSNTRSLLVY